jgi:DNA-binding IclR family transcriptional regulator
MQAIENAIQLLDCFSIEQPELGVREAARLLRLSTSSTGRLMLTLKELGVLIQNPQTHRYSLGGKVMTWSGIYLANLDVRERALPFMEKLHHMTQETISLYVMEGDERVCVERMESMHSVRIVTRIGRRLPLHAGSAGKVFLAYMPEERRENILSTSQLSPLTPNTIVNVDELRDEIARVRQKGFAVSFGEWLIDAAGVAAPILDMHGEILAALSISGPTQRFTRERVHYYTLEVVKTAHQISMALGYRGNPPAVYEEAPLPLSMP